MAENKDIKVELSEEFALKVVHCYQFLREQRNEFVMSKQLLRAGTSIGANIAESLYAESKPDFIHKLQIAQKEASETRYWLKLLYRCQYLSFEQYDCLIHDCGSILRLLSTIIRTAKSNSEAEE